MSFNLDRQPPRPAFSKTPETDSSTRKSDLLAKLDEKLSRPGVHSEDREDRNEVGGYSDTIEADGNVATNLLNKIREVLEKRPEALPDTIKNNLGGIPPHLLESFLDQAIANEQIHEIEFDTEADALQNKELEQGQRERRYLS